ncbi:MAG: hypothetical protein HKM04_07125 [Legionellales bacterium]|nr:hypothetical protein [Legionellales bacterium]
MTNQSLPEKFSFCNSETHAEYTITLDTVQLEPNVYDEMPGLATDEYVDIVEEFFASSIRDAIKKAEEIQKSGVYQIKAVRILDSENKLILGGEEKANQIAWIKPLVSKNEIEERLKLIKNLHSDASIECGWDNYETARGLRQKAFLLTLALIDKKYISHPEVSEFFYSETLTKNAADFDKQIKGSLKVF